MRVTTPVENTEPLASISGTRLRENDACEFFAKQGFSGNPEAQVIGLATSELP